MWQDNVDNWLDDNSVRGGISTAYGSARLYFGLIKWCIHIGTFGITYVLWRLVRTKDVFYCETVYSKKNEHQNISSKDAEKRIKKILDAEMIELKKGEEVLFLVEDETDSDNGLVFTNKRLVYRLLKPKAMTITSVSGQVPLSDIGNKLTADLKVNVTIKINNEAVGKLMNDRADIYGNFLDAVRKSLQNANA